MSTYLRHLTPTGALVGVGEAWVLTVETLDATSDVLSSVVAPTATVTDPAGVVTTPAMVEVTTGMWSLTTTVGVAGRWVAVVATPEDAAPAAAYAAGVTTAGGMPTVDDVAHYLRDAASGWSMAELTRAFNAERTAQRGKCGERAVYPDDLREALMRRVARNLAMRGLPLAVNVGDADTASTILPGNDPEVRRLEAPWRKLSIG
jgi:hypothetical protein